MSNAKHTPGPWSVGDKSDRHNRTQVFDVNGDPFVLVDGETTSQQLRDARLIAAAPELLEALDILTSVLANQIEIDGHDPADDARIKLARAAIAKAAGEAS